MKGRSDIRVTAIEADLGEGRDLFSEALFHRRCTLCVIDFFARRAKEESLRFSLIAEAGITQR